MTVCNHKEPTDIERLILRILNISLIIESIEKELRKQGVTAYDLKEIMTDENGTEKTMGDLHKERLKAQLDLKEKLLNHKTVPYVHSGETDFIAKVAAALLHDTDLLKDRLRAEFDDRIGDMVKRYRELSLFFVKEKPRQLVINRLREALDAMFTASFRVVLSYAGQHWRQLLERNLSKTLAINQMIEKHLAHFWMRP